ncbi:hypothetical protein [Actinokineospora sp. NBRC 105648]|uniref:hypothetical protein n=1 Tax=Actinokineospora sp. NBRC 105648 TaxID=3032206 RepID=UPI00249FC424|nr:hypothetical protein [Actinokineospora sp. NBRC 105648]GLZ42453.1 hypothetical protein Acsp05_60770 [Actinokineospora sp. NBRC 105648]
MTIKVPYITKWSAEESAPARVLALPSGIGYADETLGDRDSHGVLWSRGASTLGIGKPQFGQVHTPRQRRAMRKLLCQVCAGPADQADDGVLWLLKDHRDDWPGWPNRMAVTEPPVCKPCAQLSIQLCPALRRGHVLVRARVCPIVGVRGIQYRLRFSTLIADEPEVVPFDSARIRWTLAAQLVRELSECTIGES